MLFLLSLSLRLVGRLFDSLRPKFPTHSLQIHCIGFIGPRLHTIWAWAPKIVTLQLVPSVGNWCFSELNAQHTKAMQRYIDHWWRRPFWLWCMLRRRFLCTEQYWGLSTSSIHLMPPSRTSFSRTWRPRPLNPY